jgi:hypothetical protein
MKILQIIFLSVFVVVTASAQTPNKERLRRQQARSLLISLSTDARAFHDQTLRARSLARIADALWTPNKVDCCFASRGKRRKSRIATAM